MSRHRPFLVLAAATGLVMAACFRGEGPLQHRERAFVWEGVAGPGMTVRVRDFNGAITVEPSPDSVVRVTADISWRRGDPEKTLHFTGSRVGEDVLICAVWGQGTCSVRDYSSSFNMSRGVTDARVHFKLAVPAGVRLDLRSVLGDITAAASAPVEARTTNGDIIVVTAVGPVRGETTNGDVDLRMTSMTGSDSVVASTLNGDVFVFLPEDAAARVDLATTSGSVSTEFPMLVTGAPSRRRLQATLGAGTHPVRIRTVNGDAALRRLDAEGRAARP